MHDAKLMRTTIDLDEDVLLAAKELAAVRGTTMGRIVSELVRKGLAPTPSGRVRNGVPLLPSRGAAAVKPTMTLVNALRDEA